MSPTGSPNRLALESSPYLLAHAHNAVDWYPWGPEALERAHREGRPILLSIGYTACHWCHVMAHESFEDAATAAVMNERFVNIKVDREERPDLDRIYQLAHQLLTGRGGGWPLTVFLMHEDQRPFFAGTYFPPQPRFGLPGFRDLLVRISEYYAGNQPALRASSLRLTEALERLNAPEAAGSVAALSLAPLAVCRERLERSSDERWGGFGTAPKFPPVTLLQRLMHDWWAGERAGAPDARALAMVRRTLTGMAEGGLFDQLGGGFFRYSVDERWEIPHFEKMLYDNAALLAVYAQAAQATGEPLYAEVAARTGEWLLAEMRSPHGAFYSSLDADSEGHEGRYYLWSAEQLRAALTDEQWTVAAPHYGLEGPPNFEGRWHLCVRATTEQVAALSGLSHEHVRAGLQVARSRLLELRGQRVRPGCDRKVLASWNGQVIRALAIAARALGRDDFAAAAGSAVRYLHRVHWKDGRLLAVSFDERGRLAGYLDDYAFLLDALLELATLRCRPEELHWAGQLADALLEHFQDQHDGAFFLTADDHEPLIARPRSFADDSTPAGSAVAARALLRLGTLFGQTRYLQAAERTLQAAWPQLTLVPEAHASMLDALEERLRPAALVLLRGPAPLVEPWQTQLNAAYAPHYWSIAAPSELEALPAPLAAKPAPAQPVAYVCRALTCSAPIASIAELLHALDGSPGRVAAP